MRWKIPEALSAAERRVAERIRKRSQFFLFLREVRQELFDESFQQELATTYSPRGQDPVPPALLAMVTLLQAYTGASDAEAVDAAEMDLRWQLVLGTLGETTAPFGQGSLVRFRTRLIEADLDQRLIDRTVAVARSTGKFGWQKLRVALDSSPISGAGRVQDAWNLIGHAMSKLVAVLARAAGIDEEDIIKQSGADVLLGPSLKATLDIDWDDQKARSRALGMVVSQALALIRWADKNVAALMNRADVAAAVTVLRKVIEQNSEPDPDTPRGRTIPRGVPPDRLCSVGDPEMRHGRKSKAKAFNGYKRHIATHVDAPLVLAAYALPANQPENEAVPLLLDTVARHGDIDELFIDRGYISHDRVSELDQSKVPVRCRPWPVVNCLGLFNKNDFQIDLHRRRVTCPAGRTAEYTQAKREAVFEPKHCNSCSLRTRCTTAKKRKDRAGAPPRGSSAKATARCPDQDRSPTPSASSLRRTPTRPNPVNPGSKIPLSRSAQKHLRPTQARRRRQSDRAATGQMRLGFSGSLL